MNLGRLFLQEGISLENALDFVSEGIIVANQKRKILFINKAGRAICGISPDGDYTDWPECMGVYQENKKSLFDPEKLPLIKGLQGETVRNELVYLKNDNLHSWKCLSCSASPIINDGKIVGGIVTFKDITESRAKKKKLDEQNVKIQKASKLAALGVLAGQIGHEINNPLAIIRTGSWILRKLIAAPVLDKDLIFSKLDDIDSTIQRMSDIIVSLKNLSRDSSSEKPEEFVLRDILRDLQAICGPKLQPRGVTLMIDNSNPLLDKKILCHRVQLSEVFINLLGNAVDAVEDVSDPCIQLDVLTESDKLIMRITDNGPGVPVEMEKKIFSPFFTTKPFGEGTGLGLSISRDIMKKHGGELVLNRNISASCFDASLPLSSQR
jgi:signal transduction histidine kinase